MPTHPAAAFLHRKRVAPTKIHPPIATDGVAQAYFEDLRPMVRYARKLVREHLVPLLEQNVTRGTSDHVDGGPADEPRDEHGEWTAGGVDHEKKYPKAPKVIDGLQVGDKVENESSIEATLSNYETLPGIREVSMAGLDSDPHDLFYAKDDHDRVRNLAATIKANGRIDPLIVVIDKEGPYILEGAHRLGALHVLGKKSFPAKVVIDLDEMEKTDHVDAENTVSKPRIKAVVDRMLGAWHKRFSGPVITQAASAAAAATSKHAERELFKQIKSGLGIQLETMGGKRTQKAIDKFTTDNVALIRTVPEEYFGQIKDTVLAGVASGRRAEAIQEDLEERGEVAENRAKLIASDQVRKFNADLVETRHKELGINKYIWRRLPGAAKVPREEHIEREGNVYAYDNPPGDEDDPAEGGNPGVAINCTCWAEPFLDDILDALDEG